MSASPPPSEWKLFQDERNGFSFRYHPEWNAVIGDSAIHLMSAESELPEGVPIVDIFVQVTPLRGEFPKDYLVDKRYRAEEHGDVTRGIEYTERKEANIGGLPAWRARFRSFGPTPNWGIEYVVRKGQLVLDAYVSQPSPYIGGLFETMMSTVEW